MMSCLPFSNGGHVGAPNKCVKTVCGTNNNTIIYSHLDSFLGINQTIMTMLLTCLMSRRPNCRYL